jgi:hypothetical protein
MLDFYTPKSCFSTVLIYFALKNLALEGSWFSKRMKEVRFSVINLPGSIKLFD